MPEVRQLWVNSEYSREKFLAQLAELGVPEALRIVEMPNGIKSFTLLYRRSRSGRSIHITVPVVGEEFRAESGNFEARLGWLRAGY